MLYDSLKFAPCLSIYRRRKVMLDKIGRSYRNNETLKRGSEIRSESRVLVIGSDTIIVVA